MSDAEEVWRRKTDDHVLQAALSIGDYTEEGQRIILTEAARRGLNVAPLVQASAALQAAPSLALGWWGLPWGVVMTPVQVVRNLAGLFAAPDASRPSARLDALVRLQMAAMLVATPPTTATAPATLG